MMKKTYQIPETEIIALSMGASFMAISGVDEDGNTIIDDGGSGEGVDPNINRHSLWDEVE